jgi:hypothetical protein
MVAKPACAAGAWGLAPEDNLNARREGTLGKASRAVPP